MDSVLTIRECQLIELGILKALDRFCRERELRYAIAYGTLIGAVRHKGFIPWDNDLDVLMPRPDYEELLRLLREKTLSKDMYLLHYSVDPSYHYQCARICDARTKVEIDYIREQPAKLGVWVDVFPVDGVPDGGTQRAFMKLRMARIKILERADIYALPYAKGVKHGIKRFIRKVFPNHSNQYQSKLDELAMRTPFETACYVGNVTEYDKTYLRLTPRDFDEAVEMEFEGCLFFAPKCWHEMLTYEYGDYMVLPPERERVTHNIRAEWISGGERPSEIPCD